MEKGCPYLNMEPCVGHKCMMYTHIRGKHPQSNEEIDSHGCSIAFMPILLLDNTQQARHLGGATEGLRNEIKKSNDINQQTINAVVESIQALVTSQNQTREVIRTVAENFIQPTAITAAEPS